MLKDEHWDEIFISNEENNSNGDKASNASTTTSSSNLAKNSTPYSSQTSLSGTSSKTTSAQPNSNPQSASKFVSFFHIADFIAILSGHRVAFIDPHERMAPDERSYVAIFDLENDTQDIEQFEDQFKPLEKIFNIPLVKNRSFNGTIIRLPLRVQQSSCSVSSKLVHVKDLLVNAKDFMKEAHLHILFSRNISSIQFCRSKDGVTVEKVSLILKI